MLVIIICAFKSIEEYLMKLGKLARPHAFTYYLLGAVSALLLTFSSPLLVDILLGRVVHVTDGEAFTMVDAGERERQVRLSGIDAPERGQPYSEASALHLAGLVAGRRILVDYYQKDRHERLVGKVFFNCMDINFVQIQRGFAWHDTEDIFKQSPADMHLYATAAIKARKAATGLWQEPNPVAPWNWRHHGRTLISHP
jgi:endonuclease YncB( thermonuclease family)